jgi:hypothetical protein
MLWPATRGSGYEEQEFNAVRVQKSLAAIAIHTSFERGKIWSILQKGKD